MAQVVTFPAFAPRTARRVRTDGDGVSGKVLVFTGVWHERVESATRRTKPAKAVKPKK